MIGPYGLLKRSRACYSKSHHISVKTRRGCRPSSLRVFLLRAPSSTDVPILLLNHSLSLSLACDPALSFSALFVRLSFSFISRRQIPKTLKRPVLVNLHKTRTNLRRLAKFSRYSKLIWRQSWNKTANGLKENPN